MSIDLTAIVAIAEAAGKHILAIYNGDTAQEFVQKADHSPLTQADEASNAYIIAALRRLYPEIQIISEEEAEVAYAIRKDWPRCWQVDPLDGTKEFLNRNGEFAVNIALLAQGEAVAGVIHAPVSGETAWAARGQGAFLRKKDGAVYRLKSCPPVVGAPLRVLASRSHHNADLTAYLAGLDRPIITQAGSSLKFVRIAAGKADFYPRLGPTMEWDTSAGQIIVEEAGGKLLDAETGLPLRYNRKNMRNRNFFVYGKGVEL